MGMYPSWFKHNNIILCMPDGSYLVNPHVEKLINVDNGFRLVLEIKGDKVVEDVNVRLIKFAKGFDEKTEKNIVFMVEFI